MCRTIKHFLLLLLCTVLSSCSTTPAQLKFFSSAAESEEIFWPSLPEVPRYRYAGELIGEQNYQSDETDSSSSWTNIVNWITGLDQADEALRALVRPYTGVVAGNRIYVTDVGRGAVFVFSQKPDKLYLWDQADKGEHFISPVGIAQGAANTMLVSDSALGRIIVLSEEGVPLRSFGEQHLSRPAGLVRDINRQHIYVVDALAHDIKVFTDEGRYLNTIGLRGTQPGEFNAPTHITLFNDQLYVTDTLNARVQVLDMNGNFVRAIGRSGLYVGNLIRPKGVTLDADGNIYIIESYYDHLLVFNNMGEFLLPIGGSGVQTGQFYLPSGIWNDSHGRIYIADMYNGRIIILQYLGG